MKQAKLDSLAEIRFSDIDKEEVDTYPLFRGICDSATTKIGQKECFEKTFASLLLNSLKKDNYKVGEPIADRVMLYIKVDNEGKIALLNMDADEKTKDLFSNDSLSFKENITNKLDLISQENPIVPASLKGQNVSTQFTVPIEIKVK